MMHHRLRRLRRGYALTVVLIAIIMLFLLWSYVTRTTSSLLRIETNRLLQETRDQGAMNALAQAIQLLEYSTPSDPNNPSRTAFTYGVSVSVASTGTSGGCTTSSYTVVYTARPDLGPKRWQVQVTPGSSSTPLPSIGASPQWP
jgi:Tfp pilus assembly protein PilX